MSQPEGWYLRNAAAALTGEEVVHFDNELNLLAAWAGGESTTVRVYDIHTFENVDVFNMAQLTDPSIRRRHHVIECMENWFTYYKEENEVEDGSTPFIPFSEKQEVEILD